MQDIFDAAIAYPTGKRAAFLAEACQGDAALHSEILSLLESDDVADGLLGAVIDEAAVALPAVADPEIGLQVGPYQLVRELGRGGMGVVYLAVRSDPHYLQTVAIKLIRRGLASGMILQRFRQERQILANLTHPNIAAILDGGSTADGRPYIVMEYIEGQPITEYCDAAQLDIKARVELFRTVCAAVHHAHQKLIIHRDIKPGNVLVRSDGSPKLIDFGVAKLLIPELVPNGALQTEVSHRMMTPDYASPEQVRGEALTTQTDIYSLGITLYELLTHRRPFEFTGRPSSEFERVICFDEPQRPSEVPGGSARLRHQLKGDLDNIVLKAIAKEPRRRYNSAEQLSDDLFRYLKGDPVIARADTFRYRTGKLIRRYRTAAISAVLILLSLVAGLFATTWQARRAERRFDQVRKLAGSIIFDVSESIRDVPGTTEARASLVKTALPYLDSLAADSAGDPALLWELGSAYTKIGDIQGGPAVVNLGHPADSVVSYNKALRALNAIGTQRRDKRVMDALIDVHQNMGLLQVHMGATEEAVRHYKEALKIAQENLAKDPLDEERQRLVTSSYNRFGDAQRLFRDGPGALASYRAGLAAYRGVEPKGDQARRSYAIVYGRIAEALLETGPVPEAIDAFRRAVEVREDLNRRKPASRQFRRDLFVVYTNIGGGLAGPSHVNMGDAETGLMYFRKALDIAEKLAGSDAKNTQGRSDLGFAYANMGAGMRYTDPREAAEWYRRSLDITRGLLAEAPASSETLRWTAERRNGLSDALERQGDLRTALTELAQANQTWRTLALAEPARLDIMQDVMASSCKVADLHRRLGEIGQAIAIRDRTLPSMRPVPGESHQPLGTARFGQLFRIVRPSRNVAG